MSTFPAVRLTTYGAGTPVKSVDLDAIQDAIIAIRTQEHAHGRYSFVGSGGVALLIADGWDSAGASFAVSSDMRYLNVGDVISTIDFVYDRKGAGQMQYALVKVPKLEGGDVTIVLVNDVVSVAGIASHTLNCANEVVAAGFSYYLFMSADNACAAAGGKACSAHVHILPPGT